MTTSFQPTRVKYTRRFNLGNYAHEELEAEMNIEVGAALADGKAAMLEARKIVVESSTSYLKATRKLKEDQNENL